MSVVATIVTALLVLAVFAGLGALAYLLGEGIEKALEVLLDE